MQWNLCGIFSAATTRTKWTLYALSWLCFIHMPLNPSSWMEKLHMLFRIAHTGSHSLTLLSSQIILRLRQSLRSTTNITHHPFSLWSSQTSDGTCHSSRSFPAYYNISFDLIGLLWKLKYFTVIKIGIKKEGGRVGRKEGRQKRSNKSRGENKENKNMLNTEEDSCINTEIFKYQQTSVMWARLSFYSGRTVAL